MSVKLNLHTLSDESRDKIYDELIFTPEESKYTAGNNYYGGGTSKAIRPYDIHGDDLYIPFYYGLKNIPEANAKDREKCEKMNAQFSGTLRPLQEEIKKEALKYINKNKSVVLSLYCGAGKTITAIYLACKIGLKTLVIVNRLVLIQQWKESINNFCKNVKIQVVSPTSDFDEDADFYIINAINMPKRLHKFFDKIGTLIADEIHLIATNTLSKSFFYSTPRYCIGLSATPTRPDGMDVLLDVYFGPNKIYRKLNKEHIVYKVDTGFTPDVKLGRNGKTDWNSVLVSQAEDIERNQLIVDIIQKYPERYFLVLVKRVDQGKYLYKKLKEENESVDSIVGTTKPFDKEARILIATGQKCGTGFDHPKMNSLLLAADIQEYFIQYLGRVFRKEDDVPIIFDLVDNNPILKRHFATRKGVYLEHGGRFKKY
jgi:superfamily II DNA or RNA helicase